MVKRNVLSPITAALLGAALFVSACGDGTDDEATEWPHDWTEERVGGGQFDAGDYEGQDLVLWFWAPW